MQWLIDLVGSAWQLIKSFIDLIVHTFESILLIFRLLPEYITYAADAINILPPFLLVFAVVIFTLTVVIAVKSWVGK